MFIVIRVIIACVFFFSLMGVAKKTAGSHRRMGSMICVIAAAILLVTLSLIPMENLFVTFDSPQAAYEYFNPGTSGIELVIEGNDCDFVVARKNGADTYLIIPKTTDGWKIGLGANTRNVMRKISDGITVYVYQYKNTSDYFVTVLDTNGGTADISDKYRAEFSALKKKNAVSGQSFVTYFAHIAHFDTQYYVVVNGNKIELQNQ